MSTTSLSNFLTVIILLLMFYDKTIIIIVCLKMMFAVHTLEILVSGADFKLSLGFYSNCLSVNLQQFKYVTEKLEANELATEPLLKST